MNSALFALNAIALAALLGFNLQPGAEEHAAVAHTSTAMQARPAVFNESTAATPHLAGENAALVERSDRLVF